MIWKLLVVARTKEARMGTTLFEKIWEAHRVAELPDRRDDCSTSTGTWSMR